MENQVQHLQDLLQNERTQREVAEALQEASSALNSSLDYAEVIDRILEQIERVVPHDAANMMVVEKGDVARVFYGRGYERFGTDQTLTATTLDIQQVAGLRKMYQTGQPLVIPDVARDKDWVYSRPEHTWIKSYVGAPILLHGRAVGFLSVLSTIPNFYGQPDGERLLAFAHHAAVAFHNAQLYRRAQEEIVERRKVEAELRQHKEHLEELVAARTMELHATVIETQRLNRQLEEEVVERGRLITDLESFAHTVAHDLKGPLGVILGYTYMVLDILRERDDKDAELLEMLEPVQRTGEKMERIINELLTFASVRQHEIVPAPLEMEAVIAEVETRLNQMFLEYEAELSKPARWPVALGHAPWIEEVWTNYISNALKYGGQPPRVELGFDMVSVEPQDEASSPLTPQIRFWVRDNGAGLTAEAQERLFTKFTRFDQARATGHGLGLSIVKRIVEKLGGEVGAESAPGEGSKFFFTLPSAEEVTPTYSGGVFLSEDEQAENIVSSTLLNLSKSPLALSPQLLVELREALLTGDIANITYLTKQILAQDAALGKALEKLGATYNYPAMLELLRRIGEEHKL